MTRALARGRAPPLSSPAVLRASLVWFAQVFALGFVLGAARRAFLVERLGAAGAELVEIPAMCIAVILLARRFVRRSNFAPPTRCLAIGTLALVWLLAAECALGWALEGKRPWSTLFDRDPVAGPAYAIGLLVFALAPWWWSRRVAAGHRRGHP